MVLYTHIHYFTDISIHPHIHAHIQYIHVHVYIFTCAFKAIVADCYFSNPLWLFFQPEWWAGLIFSKPFVVVFYEFYKPFVCLLCLFVNCFYAYCQHARYTNFHELYLVMNVQYHYIYFIHIIHSCMYMLHSFIHEHVSLHYNYCNNVENLRCSKLVS